MITMSPASREKNQTLRSSAGQIRFLHPRQDCSEGERGGGGGIEGGGGGRGGFRGQGGGQAKTERERGENVQIKRSLRIPVI